MCAGSNPAEGATHPTHTSSNRHSAMCAGSNPAEGAAPDRWMAQRFYPLIVTETVAVSQVPFLSHTS